MKKKNLFIAFLACLPLALGVSCVDDAYDLSEDIDFTIQVGGSDFAIPGGATEAIPLSKLLKVNEGDIVKIDPVSGDYYLLKEGNPAYSFVKVPAFSFAQPVIDPIVKDLGFSPVSPAMLKSSDITFSADIRPAEFNTDFALNSVSVPAEVKSLSRVNANIVLQVKLLYNTPLVRKATLDDVAIYLPSFIISKSVDANHIVHVSNATITPGVPYTVDIEVEGLNINSEMFNAATHTLSVQGNVSLQGSVSVKSSDIDVSAISSPSIALSAIVSVKDASASDGNIHIVSATGKVAPDINVNVDPITLGGLPDFLDGDDVVLDVANPMVYISADNSTPVKAVVNADFTAFSRFGTVNVVAPKFEIPAMASTLFCLSPLAPDDQSAVHVSVPDLPRLVDKIPDQINVNVAAAAADEETTIRLGSNYSFTTNYKVKVPFLFGENLKIVYTDTLGEWNEDIKDVEFTRAKITGTAHNNIPLDVTLSAKGLGVAQSNGERPIINGVTARVVVPAQNGDDVIHALTTADIVVEIEETVPGSVKLLDGVAIYISATGTPSVPAESRVINKNQTFQLTNIKLKIPGGVKVDLN